MLHHYTKEKVYDKPKRFKSLIRAFLECCIVYAYRSSDCARKALKAHSY